MSEETTPEELKDRDSDDEEEDRDDPGDQQEEQEDEETAELIRTFGKCKWFDVSRGFGFIAPERDDDVTYDCDVFVYQSSIQMSGFRCLKEGERVSLWYRHSRRGLEAIKVCGPDGQDCQGRGSGPGGQQQQRRRRRRRRRRRPDRCYNCNEFGHHARQCAHERIPKRCHKCKSPDHLLATCPARQPPPVHLSTTTEGCPAATTTLPPPQSGEITRTEAATRG